MKNLILLAFLFVAKISIAQQKDTVGLNIPFHNGQIVYERIFNAPGKSSDQLFANAQLWFVKHYKNMNSILIQDEVIRRVVGGGKEFFTFKGTLGVEIPYRCNLTVQLDCKDGKYRARVFNLVVETGEANAKSFTDAELMMYSLLNVPVKVVADSRQNVFNKNQSKKALQSINLVVADLLASIDESMNDNDNF